MKSLKSFVIVAVVVTCSNLLKASPDHGATVTLENLQPNAPIFMPDGSLAPVEASFVQVLGRSVDIGGEFIVLQDDASSESVFELFHPGFFSSHFGPGSGISAPIPGITPPDEGEFIVRAWRGAATWEEAMNDPTAFIGQTPVFLNRTGSYDFSDTPLHLPESLLNMPSFTLFPVPEPSVYGLLICGAGLLIGLVFFGKH
jgi:hypothetical protein